MVKHGDVEKKMTRPRRPRPTPKIHVVLWCSISFLKLQLLKYLSGILQSHQLNSTKKRARAGADVSKIFNQL